MAITDARKLAAEIANIRRDVRALQTNARIGDSSVESSSLPFYDDEGVFLFDMPQMAESVTEIEDSITDINDSIQWHIRTFVGDPAEIDGENVGDILLDETDGYAMLRWDGSTWVPVQDAAIAAAHAAADAALAAANGKNRVWHKTYPPTDEPNTAGDTWFVYGPDDTLTARFRGTGSGWVPEQIGHQVIASLDLGKATVGLLDGVRIKAKTLTADKLLIGFGDNGAPNPGFEDGSIDPYVATGGATGVVFSDSTFTPCRSGNYSLRLMVPARASGHGHVLTTGSDTGSKMPVALGETIYAEAWMRVSGDGDAAVYVDLLRQDGTLVSSTGGTIVDSFGPYVKSVCEVQVTDPSVAFAGLAIGAGNGTVAGDQMWVDDLRISKKVTGEAIVNGSITGDHFTATTFTGVKITGALLETNPAPNVGVKMTDAGLIGYDATGVARTVIDPDTGLISAQGTLKAEAANGTAVGLSAVGNVFEGDQSWGMVSFSTAIPGWEDGLIWCRDDGSDSAAIRVSSPHNPAAAGSAWTKTALLDLRSTRTGATSAILYADSLELRGNRFNITTADNSTADVSLYGTDWFQVQQGNGSRRLAVNFSNPNTVEIRGRRKDNDEQLRLALDGETIMFFTQGSPNTLVGADQSGAAWIGRTSGGAGIMYANNETRSRDRQGNLIPHRAASHPTGSDPEWKRDMTPLTDGLAAVRALDPVRWTWQNSGHRDGTRGLGFDGSKVVEVVPEAVSGASLATGGDGLGVDAYTLLGVLWAAVKELDAKVN